MKSFLIISDTSRGQCQYKSWSKYRNTNFVTQLQRGTLAKTNALPSEETNKLVSQSKGKGSPLHAESNIDKSRTDSLINFLLKSLLVRKSIMCKVWIQMENTRIFCCCFWGNVLMLKHLLPDRILRVIRHLICHAKNLGSINIPAICTVHR